MKDGNSSIPPTNYNYLMDIYSYFLKKCGAFRMFLKITPTLMKQKKMMDVKKLKSFIMGYKTVPLSFPCTIDELAMF